MVSSENDASAALKAGYRLPLHQFCVELGGHAVALCHGFSWCCFFAPGVIFCVSAQPVALQGSISDGLHFPRACAVRRGTAGGNCDHVGFG